MVSKDVANGDDIQITDKLSLPNLVLSRSINQVHIAIGQQEVSQPRFLKVKFFKVKAQHSHGSIREDDI
jgi:hypothetical protein